MQAVILAGGEGSRLRPLTHTRPKAMIPVAGTPIIDYVIRAVAACGIREIIVVAGYRKEQVIRHLGELDIPVEIVVQEKQLGTANALLCARESVKGPFLVLPGDNFIDERSVAAIMKESPAMLVASHPQPSNFGVVTIRDGFVEEIVEKPERAEKFTVSTGIYSLEPSVFGILGACEIPQMITAAAAKGRRIRAIETDGWHDAVYPWDLLSMNRMALKTINNSRSGEISRSAVISGDVDIGEGTVIHPQTTILGPAVIGEDCEIGPQACILPFTSIGSRVKIEPFSVVENSILMDGAAIGSHSHLSDSVVGEGAALGDHTTTVSGRYVTEEQERIVAGTFGAIVGDRAKTAPNTVLSHALLGYNVSVEEGRTITGNVPDHVVVR